MSAFSFFNHFLFFLTTNKLQLRVNTVFLSLPVFDGKHLHSFRGPVDLIIKTENSK